MVGFSRPTLAGRYQSYTMYWELSVQRNGEPNLPFRTFHRAPKKLSALPQETLKLKRSIVITFFLCFALLAVTDLISSYIIRVWMIPSMSIPDMSLDEQTRNSEFWIGITSVFTYLKGAVIIWCLFIFGSLEIGARKGQTTIFAAFAVASALIVEELTFGSRLLVTTNVIFMAVALMLWNLTPMMLRLASRLKNAGSK